MTSLHDAIRRNCHLADGIYVSKQQHTLSYPSDGNALCYQLEDNSFWFRHRNACILEVVRAFPPDGPFLDVGGGNGFTSRALQEAGHDVILIEPGRDGAQNARTRGVTTVVCSTIEDLDLPDEQAGAIGMFDVIEHLPDDVSLLRYAAAKLRRGGHLFMTVPAGKILWSHEDDSAGHFRRYSRRELGKRVEAMGLRVNYISYFFSFLVVPIFLFRSLPSMLGFRNTRVTMKTYRREHGGSSVFRPLMNRELTRVRCGKTIPFGSSLILAAEK